MYNDVVDDDVDDVFDNDDDDLEIVMMLLILDRWMVNASTEDVTTNANAIIDGNFILNTCVCVFFFTSDCVEVIDGLIEEGTCRR